MTSRVLFGVSGLTQPITLSDSVAERKVICKYKVCLLAAASRAALPARAPASGAGTRASDCASSSAALHQSSARFRVPALGPAAFSHGDALQQPLSAAAVEPRGG